MGVEGGALEAHIEAGSAAGAAFGFPFEAFYAGIPTVGIVVGIDEGDVVFLGEADVFLFSDFIFFAGMDVGVVEVDGVGDAGVVEGFHYVAGARGAAGVEEERAGGILG